MNTFFSLKPCHRVSWKHPRSGPRHQVDLTVMRNASLSSSHVTYSYHSVDCDSDHSLYSYCITFVILSTRLPWTPLVRKRSIALTGLRLDFWNWNVIEAKRAALLNHKNHPSKKTLDTLRKARDNAQRTARPVSTS